MAKHLPLCVDLDGTLISCDSLHESFLKALKLAPFKTLASIRLLAKSKAAFKDGIVKLATLDASTLPYNQDVLDYIKGQRAHRKVVLVTGANVQIAALVDDHLKAFDSVMASDESKNLTGNTKRLALVEHYGESGFDYIGNEQADIDVWESAKNASVVTANADFAKQVQARFSTDQIFTVKGPTIGTWLKFARVHQWSKNLLLFVPFFLDHRFSEWSDLVTIGLSFIAFSLLASMTYMINDMLDIESDRQNSTKSKRALASGEIQVQQAATAVGALLICVLMLCLVLPSLFVLALAAYLVLTLLYSFVLKKMVIMDVCVLAALHTLRIIAGTLAVGAQWSFWLLAFSMFFFLSLAIAKRVSELENIKRENKSNPSARGYETSDINMLTSAGISAGYISILVIALYINSSKVSSIYNTPEILWFICPLLLYWIGRLWIITSRGNMHEDPIVFGLRDRTSIIILVGIAFVFSLSVLA
jgi:4-hydroxybenzoate polyprenyltransferase